MNEIEWGILDTENRVLRKYHVQYFLEKLQKEKYLANKYDLDIAKGLEHAVSMLEHWKIEQDNAIMNNRRL